MGVGEKRVFIALWTYLPWSRHWETGKRNLVCIRLVELGLRTRFLYLVHIAADEEGGLVTRNEDLDGEGELPCFFIEWSSRTVGLRCVGGMDKDEGWKTYASER